ncbi:MAG: TonB-dependent receptor [Novosphingobium sp.]
MTKLRQYAAISAIALAAMSAAPAFAQEAKDEADTTANPEIVVTAQFREQRLQDTPIAITAVNSEMLEARGQTDISQIAAQAPNVVLRPQPQNGGSGLIAFIRGVGQTDFNYAVDPGVGVYIDDVYIPTLSSSLLDLMDLDRIEVLRGPQGTLAGKNSIGGAIKLFSAKPDGSGKGSIAVTYGSYNRIDLRATADLKLGENLFARVSGVAKSRDGYVTLLDYGVSHPTSNVPANNARGGNPVVGTQGGQSFVAARLALRWMPSDNLEINVSADYTSDRSEPAGTVLLAAGRPGPTASNPNPFNPAVVNSATNANGGAWLIGKDGLPVPVNCAFVPAGANSCDTLASSVYSGDRRFISYANFLDGMTPTTQAPFKPYAALQNQNFTGWGVHGNVKLKLSDSLNVVWISSYRKYQSNFGQDQDATPVPIAQLDNELNHYAWSQELRLNGEIANGLFEFTLGGFYFDQKGTYTARVDLNYAGIDFIHGPDQTPSTSKALYFNGTLHPTDAWSINAGIRQSWDRKDYTYFRSNPDGTVPGPLPCAFFLGAPTAGPTGIGNAPNCLLLGLYNVTGLFEGKRTDWRIETDYRISPEFFVYGSVATGYKGGGVNPRPFFGPSQASCSPTPTPNCNQVQSFRPETLTTYELGFKSDLFDNKLRLNGAVFLNKYNDIQLQLTRCPAAPCLLPANAGTADVKGFELEVRAKPATGLTLDGSLSYLDFKYTNILASTNIPITNVTAYTPKWTYSFGVQYDWSMAGGNMSARFDGQYQSEIFTDANNSVWSRVEPRFLGNARLTYTTTDKDWQLGLEVQNVFNRFYYLTVSDVTGGLGVQTGVPGLPRTWALTVKRSF